MYIIYYRLVHHGLFILTRLIRVQDFSRMRISYQLSARQVNYTGPLASKLYSQPSYIPHSYPKSSFPTLPLFPPTSLLPFGPPHL